MTLALILAALSAAILIPLAIRRFKKVGATFDTIVDLGTAEDLAFDEAEHVKALAPKVEFVPDGFTCLDCGENPALPFTIWCIVCNRAAWASFTAPQQPIEWGQR
jgi:hypothetical protein